MSVTVKQPKPPRPSLIDGKNIADILCPKPVTVTVNGHTLQLLPMADEQLLTVTDCLETIVRVLQECVGDVTEAGSQFQLYAAIPSIFKFALKDANSVIGAAFGLDAESVSAIKLAHRVEMLKGVMEAEDIPLLLKNVSGLVSIFAPQAPTVKVDEEAKTE